MSTSATEKEDYEKLLQSFMRTTEERLEELNKKYEELSDEIREIEETIVTVEDICSLYGVETMEEAREKFKRFI